MSLLSNVPMSNLTIYRIDYKKKALKRREKFTPLRDYDDPLAGPYEEYLLPYRKYNTVLKPTCYPDPKEYTDQICDRYPRLKRYLKDPDGPNFEVIDRLYDNDNRSTYMVSYCVLGDYESKITLSRKTRPLPEGWEVPLTTQKCAYRSPKTFLQGRIPGIAVGRLVDNLKPNEKERAILGVKTGESEYMAWIGKTGEEIIDGKLHGDVNMRPQFSQDELLRAMLIRRE